MDIDWLRYVCECRKGDDEYKLYDAVIDYVADDDVYKCVNMYMKGAWNENRTLKEMEYILSQEIIDASLVFIKSYGVNANEPR